LFLKRHTFPPKKHGSLKPSLSESEKTYLESTKPSNFIIFRFKEIFMIYEIILKNLEQEKLLTTYSFGTANSSLPLTLSLIFKERRNG